MLLLKCIFYNILGVDDQILALAVLPYLFKPFVVQPKKKGGPDAWRASKAEIAQGFIYNVSVSFSCIT